MLVQCMKWQIIGTGVCTLHAQWVHVETVFTGILIVCAAQILKAKRSCGRTVHVED